MGQFTLILGPMFSGKTSLLIQLYKKYIIAGKKCLIIKYENDFRYDLTSVVTHDNIKVEAILAKNLLDLDEKIKDFDVICIDEIQFFSDGIMCDIWATRGKIVIASGLNGTYQRKPWEVISKLIPLVDDIIHLKAICRETGNNAPFTYRNIQEKSEFLIGGSEIYSAVDRETFYNKNNN